MTIIIMSICFQKFAVWCSKTILLQAKLFINLFFENSEHSNQKNKKILVIVISNSKVKNTNLIFLLK